MAAAALTVNASVVAGLNATVGPKDSHLCLPRRAAHRERWLIPATAVTMSGPQASPRAPGLVARARVTVPVKLGSRLPNASSPSTTTLKPLPAVTLPAAAQRHQWVAAAGTMVNDPVTASLTPSLDACKRNPSRHVQERLENVAIPSLAVTLVDPPSVAPPGLFDEDRSRCPKSEGARFPN